ncbi:MAG TPA: hypothetical protein VJ715_03345, partial [Pyrinomonadaceae bacterium]|nr:hypothetical protein [Pyrinomonadaceae bacterium]
LFYVYPLKFLWTLLVNLVLGFPQSGGTQAGTPVPPIEVHQIPTLLGIFGAGYVTISLIFALLYYHAYRKRAQLDLNELEIHDTWNNISENLLNVLVGVLSIVLAFVTRSGMAGMVYWLIGPVQYVNGMVMGKRRKRIEERMEAEARADAPA